EADRDGDHLISVDDLYDYVYDEVRRATPSQTPSKWSSVEGALVLARAPGAASGRETAPDEAAAPTRRAEPVERETLESVPPTERTNRAAWLPALIVGGGWASAWLVSFALASSAWVEDMIAAVFLALIGWLTAA